MLRLLEEVGAGRLRFKSVNASGGRCFPCGLLVLTRIAAALLLPRKVWVRLLPLIDFSNAGCSMTLC